MFLKSFCHCPPEADGKASKTERVRRPATAQLINSTLSGKERGVERREIFLFLFLPEVLQTNVTFIIMKKKTAILVTLFLSAAGFIYSQETRKISTDTTRQIAGLPSGTLTDSIKTVTITATRTEKNVMDVGRSVTVISGDQLNVPGCNNVAELLSQQEGIYISGTGQNPGAIQSLFMRGADANHTAIMIDGVPLSDPATDHGQLDLSELSLADVDKIEIVRGSHSTLYGSSSIGGVINIMTKKKYTPGIHVSANVTGGEFGTQTSTLDENVLLDYTFKNGLYLTGGYHRLDVKGLNATVDTFSHPLSYQMNPDKDNYNKSEPFAKLGFYNKNWDIYAEYKNLIENTDADGGAFTDIKNATDHFVRDFYTGGITYKLNDNFHLQYTGSYSHDIRVYRQGQDTVDMFGDVSTEDDFFTGTSMFHDFKATYIFKTSHFIAGGGYTKESMTLNTYSYNSAFGYYDDTPDSVKFEQSTANFYAQADINGGTFASSLSPYNLLLGARYTNNSVFGSNETYDINPSVKVGANSLLYLSYSTGFATPSLYELYAPNKYGDNPANSYTLGNTQLKPETSSSFEIGIKHSIANNLFFTISWFKTKVENHIDYVGLWNPNKAIDSLGYGDNLGYRYINLGEQITQGFEVNVFLKLSEKVGVSGNISLLSSALKYSANNIDTTQTHNAKVQIYDGGSFLGTAGQNTGLLRRPGGLGNFSITWRPVKKLALTLRARYVGASYDAVYNSTLGVNYYGALAFVNVGDYTLLDVSASYEITKQFSVMARGENMLNTTYYEILGYSTRGRSFYLNLRYTF